MASSLIHGKYVIAGVNSPTHALVVDDGAVYQEDGIIVEVGPFAELSRKYQPDQVLGASDTVIVPGFTNGHHHVGLTPVQLGSPDLALEMWFASRSEARAVDLYLDTLYSAFEMVESGVTTVSHIHGWRGGSLGQLTEAAESILKAYSDIGMRVSYSFAVRDQNRLVYEADDEFVKRVPPSLQPALAAWFQAATLPVEDHFALFEHLHAKYQQCERTKIQLAPANLHWCSDDLLLMLQDYSSKYHVPMHMHVLESAYQKEYARRRTGTTAVRHLYNLGLLGPHMTYGHGVWLNEDDIELTADTGTRVCHNASSNLRLRSGVLPLNRLIERGVRVGMGMDEAGINDDRDMLQELKLVLRLHRTPGMDDCVPTCENVLRMATEFGAETTAFGQTIGRLEPGRAADMVLLNWNDIAYPYLDEDTPVVDAVVQRARTSGVKTVVVAGEEILRDGKFTRLDKKAMLDELAASLSGPKTDAELARRQLMRVLRPHLLRYWDGYLDQQVRTPFHEFNSRY
jgi:cytosine/adenosine deaminase-related metal-dependent hydrolase